MHNIFCLLFHNKLITRAMQEKRKVRKYRETYEEEVQKSFRIDLTVQI